MMIGGLGIRQDKAQDTRSERTPANRSGVRKFSKTRMCACNLKSAQPNECFAAHVRERKQTTTRAAVHTCASARQCDLTFHHVVHSPYQARAQGSAKSSLHKWCNGLALGTTDELLQYASAKEFQPLHDHLTCPCAYVKQVVVL